MEPNQKHMGKQQYDESGEIVCRRKTDENGSGSSQVAGAGAGGGSSFSIFQLWSLL
jgi:hypothetical protein